MEDSFIVVTAEEMGNDDKTFSLCSAAGEAEAHIRSLVESGTPPESIRVYRARPLPLRRPAPRKKKSSGRRLGSFRRERIQPILDFLEAAKTLRASQVGAGFIQSTVTDLEKAFESNPEHPLVLEAKRHLMNKSLGDEPDVLQLVRLSVVASASAPTPEIRQGVISRVFLAAITPREKASESLDDATSAAEEIIEKYLTVV